MIISIDNHVGLPFLEGLCADLQMQIQQRQAAQALRASRNRFRIAVDWQKTASKAVTALCALTGTLIALLEIRSSL